MGAGGTERVRSWLMATSDMVMQGWGAVRDFATVKDACPAGLRRIRLSSDSDSDVIFTFSGIKTRRCADVQTVHGCEKLRPSRWFVPFFRAGKKSAGMQPTLLVTTGQRHNVDGHLGRVDLVSVQV